MSSNTESGDDGKLNAIKGPKVQTTRMNTLDGLLNADSPFSPGTAGLSGNSWRSVLGEQYSGDRQLFDVLGYSHPLRSKHYIAKYERGPGIARGIIDKPVHDCWKGEIEIEEAEDQETDETAFEKEVRKFIEGEYTRMPPVARFRAADRWARLLEYSLVLIGVNDSSAEGEGSQGLSEPVDTGSIDSMDDLNFLAVYKQTQVDWENTEINEDPTDPRYRLPETYNVEVSDGENEDIHHSRIIHVVEEPDEDELRSTPLYKPIFNRLDDLQKLLGGSAEMFWRAAWPGLVLKPPTDADGVPMRFEDSGESVADQIAQYRNNLKRLHRITGELETLDPNVESPEEQIGVQIEDISAHVDIPMSVMRGNETGERATEQDKAMYHEFISGRRSEHCEEQFWRKVLERFLDWGILPSTESGDEESNSWNVVWPPQQEPTESEKADIAQKWATAYKEMGGGSPGQIASAAERRMKLGHDPEYGSDAPNAADPEELAAENLEVPEEEDQPENMPEGNSSEGTDDEDPEEDDQ